MALTRWTFVGKVMSLLFTEIEYYNSLKTLLSFESVFLMLSTTSLTAITRSKLQSNARGLTGMLLHRCMDTAGEVWLDTLDVHVGASRSSPPGSSVGRCQGRKACGSIGMNAGKLKPKKFHWVVRQFLGLQSIPKLLQAVGLFIFCILTLLLY